MRGKTLSPPILFTIILGLLDAFLFDGGCHNRIVAPRVDVEINAPGGGNLTGLRQGQQRAELIRTHFSASNGQQFIGRLDLL
jgi:hypothetical protein